MTGSTRYLLDTNILSALARNPQGSVADHIRQKGEASLCTSVVVACEVQFGLTKSGSVALRDRMERILGTILTLPLEPPVERHYADIRWELEKTGKPIGPNDLLIAAQARRLGLTVVTDNVEEFQRVPGLAVENWL